METAVLQLDKASANDFWRLRIELLEELGEVREGTDVSELESATKQYDLSHINKDLFSWGIVQKEQLVAIGSLCLFARVPYQENLSGSERYILGPYVNRP